MQGLLSLPYEVLSNIVDTISFDDYYNLGLSCKHLSFLLREEQMCKLVVQLSTAELTAYMITKSKIPYSYEAKEARESATNHARSFRRAAKRYEALTSAVPFVVATVGFCDAFLYCKCVLCYTIDGTLRILSPHIASDLELVVSIPNLIRNALQIGGENHTGNFLVLYCSDGIISCLYKSYGPDSAEWLIVFQLETQTVLMTHELSSTEKIFVRNNSDVLYYGTHSDICAEGYKKWVIHGYQFTTEKWFEEKIRLPDMVGSEIGSTICFEFYNGFFYALSNQTSFEVEEIDWTSFYHCARFPLDSPTMKLVEYTEDDKMWRRQHQEGPIDDRWTVLRLDVNECSGELNIVESRKEWYMGSSRSQRTYYTTPIIFPDLNTNQRDIKNAHALAASAVATSPAVLTNPSWVPPAVPTTTSTSPYTTTNASTSSSASTSNTSLTSTASASSTSTAPASNEKTAHFPNAQLAKLLMPDDNPNHIEAPIRQPQFTHPGNDGSHQPIYPLAKSRIRTYHTGCQTFMDVVDDPLPSDTYGTQRIRLRSGTRNLKQPPRDANGITRDPSKDLDTALKELYDVPEIQYWPKKQDPKKMDFDNDALYKLLNPPLYLGNVDGVADERSIVYSTGPIGKPQALIFISFDPATQLDGLKHWGGLNLKGLGEGPHIDGRAAADITFNLNIVSDHDKMDHIDNDDSWDELNNAYDFGNEDFDNEVDRTVVIDYKGKGKADMNDGPIVHGNYGSGQDFSMLDGVERGGSIQHADETMEAGSVERTCSSPWIWEEVAMHKAIKLGYYFGRRKVDTKMAL